MFNPFKRTVPRISEEEKNQLASAAWDSVITPINENPNAVMDTVFDTFFGIANDVVTSK